MQEFYVYVPQQPGILFDRYKNSLEKSNFEV